MAPSTFSSVEELAELFQETLETLVVNEPPSIDDDLTHFYFVDELGISEDDFKALKDAVAAGLSFSSELTRPADLSQTWAESLYPDFDTNHLEGVNVSYWLTQALSPSDFLYFVDGQNISDADQVETILHEFNNQ